MTDARTASIAAADGVSPSAPVDGERAPGNPFSAVPDAPLDGAIERSRWQRSYSANLRITDTLVVVAAVILAQLVRFGSLVDAPGYAPLFVPAFSLLFVVGWLASLSGFHTRSARLVGTGVEEYRRVVGASFWTFGAIAIVTLLFKADIARGYLAVALPVGTVALVLSRWAWQVSVARKRVNGMCTTAVLAFGEEDAVVDFVKELTRNRSDGYRVVGICMPGHGPSRGEHLTINGEQIPIVGGESDMMAAIRTCGADTVAIAGTEHFGVRGIRRLIWDLEPVGVDLVISTGVMDVTLSRLVMRPIAGLPLLHIEKPQYRGAKRFQKRTFDLTFAAAVLAVTSPLLALAALAIKLTSRGPVFDAELHVGRDGQEFALLRLRTVVVAKGGSDPQLTLIEPDGRQLALSDDPGVTPIGRVLRRFSIDCLPQFINVLKGEMSVVGPRAPYRHEVEAADVEVLRRLLVRPGVSGLWRVSGRADLDWTESVRLDLSYIDNWSMTSDLMIALKSVKPLAQRLNTHSSNMPGLRPLDQRAQDFAELHRRIVCVEDEAQLINLLMNPGRPYVVSFVNAHAANLVWRSPALRECLMQSDLLLRDGIGVDLGLRAFGWPSGLNMNGTDLIPKIACAYAGRRVALFGTESPWLDAAAAKLKALGVSVVARHHGFATTRTYVELAMQHEPDLIILAMGMPKQEIVSRHLKEQLSNPVLILNGGAILDFLGDKVTRAPGLMSRTGTEWLYRLMLEPRRMARRYIVGIPEFLSHTARARRHTGLQGEIAGSSTPFVVSAMPAAGDPR